MLIENGVDIHTVLHYHDGTTALHIANIMRYLDLVQYLPDHGADIEARDKSGRTLLACAAALGSVKDSLPKHDVHCVRWYLHYYDERWIPKTIHELIWTGSVETIALLLNNRQVL